MNFVLPSKADVGYLAGDVAEEGQKVILDSGEQVSWTPPPVRPSVPDMSQIKAIRHYFGRAGHQVYPAWLFHPTEKAVLVKDAKEAEKYGVRFRKATQEENERFGVTSSWDFADDTKWRVKPLQARVVDPNNLETGKNYIAATTMPHIAQNAMIEALIPAVAAAVAKSLQSSGPSAPANIDPKQWESFLAFQAFQKTTETVNALSDDVDRENLAAEAERKGIKVDKRWSMNRLQAEVEKAA